MTRLDKIGRLVAVGFSATELSRASNDLLDSTYIAAKDLMKSKQDEVARVMNREGARSARLRSLVADRQRNEKIETEWARKWKPLPPIRTVGTDVEDILDGIKFHRISHETQKELFKKTGFNRHAVAARNALTTMRNLQGQLSHLQEGK